MGKIIKYILLDILRNKIVLAYTTLLFAITFCVFSLEDSTQKGLLTALNLILFIVPLVSIIFSTIYMYNSAEFIELLLSQPLRRRNIWLSLFSGLAGALSLSFIIGVGIPMLIYDRSAVALMMLANGLLITIIFASLAMLAAVHTRDKAKGIGVSILLWLYFSLVYDGLVLFLLFQFSDYPLEKAMIVLCALNPVDLGRILILLKMDVSALMGFTGAVFREFYGTKQGLIVSFSFMTLWAAVPVFLSLRKFNRKDL